MNNSLAWNYVGEGGKLSLIALQHDRKTGNLVIFCDKELVWAERSVRDEQIITFFIGDELCKIYITPIDNQFKYEFEIDRKTDTPLNVHRKKEERSGIIKGIAFLGAIVGAVLSFIGVGFLYNQYSDYRSLRENGKETTAYIKLYPSSTGKNCRYSFNYGGIECEFYTSLQKVGDSLVLPCGLPARNDDAFFIRYDPTELTNHVLDLEAPSEKTAGELVRRTRDKIREDYGFSEVEADCLALMTHRLSDFRGLSDFYFSKATIFQNPYHNSLTFYYQQHRPDFKDDFGECVESQYLIF
jgi:hypothetical protein